MNQTTDVSTMLRELEQASHYVRKVEKGTYLFQEGSHANELFIVKKGMIQISKIVPDGRELTIRLSSEGDLIGEMALFCNSPKYVQNAKVIESGEVAVIYRDVLEDKLAGNSVLAVELIKWMGVQQRKSQAKFRDLILHGKKGALYSTLIRLSNSYGKMIDGDIVFDISLTNQELANFCGTSREVVNRLLSELRKNDVLSIDKGFITIHDLDYLRNEIDCENCPLDICNIE